MKHPKEQKLIRRQVSAKLERLKESLQDVYPIKSWSTYLRTALGMSGSQLGQRLKIAQSSASELEKREREGKLTLNKLKEIANAMECDLFYSFIPRKPLEKIVLDQATKKALKTMQLSDTHMALESQKVTTDHHERLDDLIQEKIYSKYLWDEHE